MPAECRRERPRRSQPLLAGLSQPPSRRDIGRHCFPDRGRAERPTGDVWVHPFRREIVARSFYTDEIDLGHCRDHARRQSSCRVGAPKAPMKQDTAAPAAQLTPHTPGLISRYSTDTPISQHTAPAPQHAPPAHVSASKPPSPMAHHAAVSRIDLIRGSEPARKAAAPTPAEPHIRRPPSRYRR